MAERPKPHGMNVPGDFYVVDQCCTACGVPTEHAPETFSWEGTGRMEHCYVKRQPATPGELERALFVMRAQELGCIRYRGTDPVVLRRLTEAGEGGQCDAPLPPGVHPLVRDHVTLEARAPDASGWTPAEVLERFRQWLGARRPNYRSTPTEATASGASLAFSWWQENFHRVSAEALVGSPGRWLLRHEGSLGVSDTLVDWLESSAELAAVRWFTREEWERGLSGQERHW